MRFPDGETKAKLLVTRVLVQRDRKRYDEASPHDEITLKVSPIQAERLDLAQKRGTLHWVLRKHQDLEWREGEPTEIKDEDFFTLPVKQKRNSGSGDSSSNR